jgi:hypothetical protein
MDNDTGNNWVKPKLVGQTHISSNVKSTRHVNVISFSCDNCKFKSLRYQRTK